MSILKLPPENRTCLITGCSSGIGLQTALYLREKGVRVFATARQQADLQMLNDMGLESFYCEMNDSISINQMLSDVLEKTNGQLYALFNNAGFSQPGAVEDLNTQVAKGQFETNVMGVLELTNLVLPIMRSQGYGKILQMSSFLGFISVPLFGAYNASKHALEGLTDTLRMELSHTPIDIVTIRPGPIATKAQKNAFNKLQENIDTKNSHYHKAYVLLKKDFKRKNRMAPFALPASAVSQVVWRILTSKKPKAKYHITHLTKLFALLKRMLPESVLTEIILKATNSKIMIKNDED